MHITYVGRSSANPTSRLLGACAGIAYYGELSTPSPRNLWSERYLMYTSIVPPPPMFRPTSNGEQQADAPSARLPRYVVCPFYPCSGQGLILHLYFCPHLLRRFCLFSSRSLVCLVFVSTAHILRPLPVRNACFYRALEGHTFPPLS